MVSRERKSTCWTTRTRRIAGVREAQRATPPRRVANNQVAGRSLHRTPRFEHERHAFGQNVGLEHRGHRLHLRAPVRQAIVAEDRRNTICRRVARVARAPTGRDQSLEASRRSRPDRTAAPRAPSSHRGARRTTAATRARSRQSRASREGKGLGPMTRLPTRAARPPREERALGLRTVASLGSTESCVCMDISSITRAY